MEAKRQILFYEVCFITYDFVLRRVLSRKQFLRYFDFRVRFNETVQVHYFETKYPLEIYKCPTKYNHIPI